MANENYARYLKKSGVLYRRKRKLEEMRYEEEDDVAAVLSFDHTNDGMVEPNYDLAAECICDESSTNEEENIKFSSSSSEEESDSNEGIDFKTMTITDCLRYFALFTKQKHSAVNLLLTILKTKTNFVLPRDARTLLNTNRSKPVINAIGSGSFWNRDIKKALMDNLRFAVVADTLLSLNIFIDGLPLHKSSNMQFWPILISIQEMPLIAPITVALFCGRTKPTKAFLKGKY
ncbi:uncharacterized protein LOC128309206 [Anopheles moucheti]|uniref:uncharacterized protein LOC128309206 n=1 Tax=Anopheles moucheti TaxID=186751 RepID=UPI0022F1000B|nr:uncharacterized protein LOC128309206 [Anopheles moucheti]